MTGAQAVGIASWVFALCCAATGAGAQESGKSSFEALRAELEGRRLARVSAAWGIARLESPRVNGMWLSYSNARPDTGGTFLTPVPDSIAFVEVLRVEVHESHAIEGGLLGGTLLLLLVAGANSQLPHFDTPGTAPRRGEQLERVLLPTLSFGVGATAGAWLGSRRGYWRAVYVR